MIDVYNKATNELLGSITEADLTMNLDEKPARRK